MKKKISIIATLLLVLIAIASISYGADTIAVIDAEADYLIYTNYKEDFKYAFSEDSNAPTVYYQCKKDTKGNNIVKVPKDSISTAKYLYTQTAAGEKLLDGIEVNYSGALKTQEIEFISILTQNIKVKPVAEDDNSVTITDTTCTDLKYILINLMKLEKAADITDYNLLVARARLTTNFATDSSDPIDSITSMQQFLEIFNKLLPKDTDSRWASVPGDNVIEEPSDTKPDDIYVLWIMGTRNKEVVKDIQILTCKRRDDVVEVQGEEEVIKTRIIRLPKTGADFILEGAIIITVIIIAFTCLKIRNLEKKTIRSK